MRYATPSIAVATFFATSCTLSGLQGMHLAAVATCATGAAIEAAGEPAGGVIEAAACWLADYTAARIERLESDQSESGSVDTAADAEMDAAVEELDEALRACDQGGATRDQESAVARAWAKCRSLESVK